MSRNAFFTSAGVWTVGALTLFGVAGDAWNGDLVRILASEWAPTAVLSLAVIASMGKPER